VELGGLGGGDVLVQRIRIKPRRPDRRASMLVGNPVKALVSTTSSIELCTTIRR
jgi:hypothetical protein